MPRRPHHPPEAWPRLMQAPTAAAYVDESSVDSFRRSVGSLWPRAIHVPGKGERWTREDLDEAIDRATGKTARANRPGPARDLAGGV